MNENGQRPTSRIDSRRAGFSLIELLMAVSIVGILTGLAIPNLRNMTFRARATEVAADVNVVRVATVNYNADQNAWPADAAAGVVPPELSAYVPDGFFFQGNGYVLKFENLNFPMGLPGDPNTRRLIAVSVEADNDQLSNAIVELLSSSIVISVGRIHTFVIDRH